MLSGVVNVNKLFESRIFVEMTKMIIPSMKFNLQIAVCWCMVSESFIIPSGELN